VASGAAAPVFIDQFNESVNGSANDYVNQTILPTTTGIGSDFLAAGDSATEGSLSYDPNSDALVFGGFSGPAVGTATINTTTSTTANRDIGTVNASGTFSFAVQNNAQYGDGTGGSGTLRGAVTDGSGNYWASGTSGANGGTEQGIWYYAPNTPAQLTPTSLSTRSIQTYGGNLYYSTGAGVYEISGQPQSGSPTLQLLLTPHGTSSPYGFVFSPDMTVCYVANEETTLAAGEGIQRFNLVGGVWTYEYTIASAGECDYLTADFSGGDANPVIYATTVASATGNELVEITDTGSGSGDTVLDTIAGSSADAGNYDGIVLVPVPEPSVFALAGLGLVLFLGYRQRMDKEWRAASSERKAENWKAEKQKLTRKGI
jgi:hypothetical protein